MKEYVLNDDYDKEELKKIVREANTLMDLLWSHDILEEENDDPRVVQAFGMYYQVCEIHQGISIEHLHSDACCTFECQQVPSADVYYFEATEEFLKNYIEILRKMCKEHRLQFEE